MSPEMVDTLELLCKEVDKKYGKGTVSKLNANTVPELDEVIPTGSISLDIALGIGGFKKGRIVEVLGESSTGKTTLCLHAIVNAQKLGKSCLFVDAEQSYDVGYSQSLGVDLDKLLFVQPNFMEEALDIADIFARSGEVGLIVIDSVAALVPKAELEGDIEQASVGRQALLMSKAMRKLVGICNKTGTTIIFTNQWRQKIGIMFGNPNISSGGKSLAFYASQRLDIKRTGDIKSGENIIGHSTKVTVIKNKCSAPKKIAEFDIIFGKGIDTDGEIIDLALLDKVIDKSGAWYKYNGESIAQGRPNAISWLNENPELKEQIKKTLLENRGLR